jgi:ATP-binding cassette subfamily B protein
MEENSETSSAMSFSGISRLLQIAGRKKILLIASSTYSVVSEIFALIIFLVIYLVTVELINPHIEWNHIWTYIWIAVVALLGRMALKYCSTILSHIAAFNILYELRVSITKHLGGLNMGYFSHHNTGSLKKILNEDVEQIELFVAHHIPDLAAGIAIPVFTTIFLFIFDWRLALAMLVPVPLAFVALNSTFAQNKDEMGKYHQAMECMNSTIIEYVRGMPVIKIFNQTVQSFTRFQSTVYTFRDFCNDWTERSIGSWAIFVALLGAPLLFILPVGIWLYLAGQLQLPVLILFLIVGVGYMKPVYALMRVGSMLAQITEGVRRVDSILEQKGLPEPASPKIPENYSIEFQNVDFAYDENQVLHDVSFKIDEGKVFALVGPSGSGKTTIANLTARLWDINKGKILIGGVNIKDIPLDYLMDKTALVFQDVFIFSDTVMENIKMGRENVNEEDVIAAAKAANIHDFIMEELPKGYQTLIGESGVHLSGGEKQRISLARAMLKDAPIVVLDEATAFADPENEVKIQEAFSELLKNRTVLIIAHRLSTITDSDEIMVLDEGSIVERGTHEKLLENRNLYWEMWESHTSAREWTFKSVGGDVDV